MGWALALHINTISFSCRSFNLPNGSQSVKVLSGITTEQLREHHNYGLHEKSLRAIDMQPGNKEKSGDLAQKINEWGNGCNACRFQRLFVQ